MIVRRQTIRLAATIAALVAAGSLVMAPAWTAAAEDSASRDVKTYCANIAVAASDARIAWQTGRLAELEASLKATIATLDARTAVLRDWAQKRADLEKKAGEKLVGIYAKMRPETAAVQIATLDDDMAAAVLGALNARQAGAIFNEIVPERAARLAALIAGTAPDKKL